MPVGAVTSIVGAYGAELQARPADPCVLGMGALGCLDSKIVLRKGDKTLSYRVIAQGDVPFTELIFEPSSPQSLRFLYQFDQSHKEVIATLESWRGDRLRAIVKILRAPNELNCPVLLPSDFTDDQKIEEVYQCFIDAGVHVETKLQFNDYSVTLPALLSSDRDYAAAEQAIRQIAGRVDPFFKEAMKSFLAFFINDNQAGQALAQCLLSKSTQQTSAGRMVTLLDSSRAWACMVCGSGILGAALFWDGMLTLSGPVPVAVAVRVILRLYGVWPVGAAATTINCIRCFRGSGGGGGSNGDRVCFKPGSRLTLLARCPHD